MSNSYYGATGNPGTSSFGQSANIRAEFALIASAFDRLPTLSGNANKIVTVNGGGSGMNTSPISINGILQMLDPAYVSDYTGIPVGSKRLNGALGFQSWDGTTWNNVAVGYLPIGGGTMTGPLQFAGAAPLSGVIGASTLADTFTVDTDKVLSNYGLAWKAFSDIPGGGPAAALSGYGGVRFYSGSLERMRLLLGGNLLLGSTADNGSKLQVNGAVTASIFLASGNTEGFRISQDSGFLSIWNTANSVESGILQGVAGSTFLLRALGTANLDLFAQSSTGLRVTPAGTITESVTGIELGYKGMPVSSSFVNGQCWVTTTSQTVPNNQPVGTVFGFFNASAVTVTLTPASGLTIRLGGTTISGARTVAPWGMVTIWYQLASQAIVNGNLT